MRRVMALLFVCALVVIASGFGHSAVISGLSLKAAIQPVTQNPIVGKTAGHAGTGMKVVEFRGYAFQVPASWPVYSLSKDPDQCVRYDVNAVYLGTPGPNQHCPPDLVGTADTVSVGGPAIPGVLVTSAKTGDRAKVGDLRSATEVRAAPGTIMQNPGQHQFGLVMPSSAPSVTATYGRDPGLIVQVFNSLHPLNSRPGDPWGTTHPTPAPFASRSGRPTDPGWISPSPVTQPTRPPVIPSAPFTPPTTDPSPRPTHLATPSPTRTTPAPTEAPVSPAPSPTTPAPTPTSTQAPEADVTVTPSAPGSGTPAPGFDTCTAPSLSAMKAWRAKFSVANIYIGGQEMACDYGNLSASWIQAVEADNWSLMPTFVGLQAPCNDYSAEINPSQAAAEGIAAANLAISDAKQFDLGPGSPIYFDMEGYDHTNTGCVTAVLTFLDSWTRQLNAGGYVSGVYSSADSAAIDLQSNTTIAGHSLAEPQDMWFALWDNVQNLTGSPYLTGAVWPDTQRSKQFEGGHVVSVGGYSLDIDSDLVDSAVARG
jgi:hypothetical protein